MNENTRAFINELLAKAKHLKDNGPITLTADQLWKYSGEVELTNVELLDQKENERQYKYFKKTVKGKDLSIFLSKRDGVIIDYFYKNHNHTMEKMAEDLKMSVTTIRKTIEKYLKMKRD